MFEMPNFVMILDMECISRYGVEIDCKKKKVKFSVENGDKFFFGES